MKNRQRLAKLGLLTLPFALVSLPALAAPIPTPGAVIINEFNSENGAAPVTGNDYFELLVTQTVDLRGLRVSDNELISGALNNGESVFIFGQDSFLENVPAGTIIGVWTTSTGVVTDTVANATANDFSMVLAPGTGVTVSVDGLGGSSNAGLSTSQDDLYVYLPGPDGNSAGTDNVYLDYVAYGTGTGGGEVPSGLSFPTRLTPRGGAYTGNCTTTGSNDGTANWTIFSTATSPVQSAPAGTNASSPGLPNAGQDLAACRAVDVEVSSVAPRQAVGLFGILGLAALAVRRGRVGGRRLGGRRSVDTAMSASSGSVA